MLHKIGNVLSVNISMWMINVFIMLKEKFVYNFIILIKLLDMYCNIFLKDKRIPCQTITILYVMYY